MALLHNKSIIVSGASSGIGAAAARLFAAQGARLVLVARRQGRLTELAREINETGGKAEICVGDISASETHHCAVDIARDIHGGLDGAFNNAGMVGPVQPLANISAGDFAKVLAVNLTGAFLAAKAQIPALLERGGGSLAFTGSFVGVSAGLPGMGAYATGKAGLLGLVRAITADYAEQRIRATALLPGGTDTEMAGDDETKAWAAELHAMKRIAQPEEIAQAALFLLSDMSSFVTGSALWVDGGNAAVKV